jgi:hypothetical protein
MTLLAELPPPVVRRRVTHSRRWRMSDRSAGSTQACMAPGRAAVLRLKPRHLPTALAASGRLGEAAT